MLGTITLSASTFLYYILWLTEASFPAWVVTSLLLGLGFSFFSGTVVNLAAGGGTRGAVRFGHPSGTLRVGADVQQADGQWVVTKAVMSRSARVLMEGTVRVPRE